MSRVEIALIILAAGMAGLASAVLDIQRYIDEQKKQSKKDRKEP